MTSALRRMMVTQLLQFHDMFPEAQQISLSLACCELCRCASSSPMLNTSLELLHSGDDFSECLECQGLKGVCLAAETLC